MLIDGLVGPMEGDCGDIDGCPGSFSEGITGIFGPVPGISLDFSSLPSSILGEIGGCIIGLGSGVVDGSLVSLSDCFSI